MYLPWFRIVVFSLCPCLCCLNHLFIAVWCHCVLLHLSSHLSLYLSQLPVASPAVRQQRCQADLANSHASEFPWQQASSCTQPMLWYPLLDSSAASILFRTNEWTKDPIFSAVFTPDTADTVSHLHGNVSSLHLFSHQRGIWHSCKSAFPLCWRIGSKASLRTFFSVHFAVDDYLAESF